MNQPLFNDFFAYNMQLSMGEEREASNAVMSPAEFDELFDLFSTAGLPDTAMNPEMADGYLTACVIGPDCPPTHEWLERIFGQPNLPICADQTQQDRLFTLLNRRSRDIQRATRLTRKETTADNMFVPSFGDIDLKDRIYPYQCETEGKRLGAWKGKNWVKGFLLDVRQDPAWDPFLDDPEQLVALAPFMLYDSGYNIDRLSDQIDDMPELLGYLCLSVSEIRKFWREFRRNEADEQAFLDSITIAPFVRPAPKTGRNDPCTCGSGKKFKKCCGT